MDLAKLAKTGLVSSNYGEPHSSVWLAIVIIFATTCSCFAQNKQVRFEIRSANGDRLPLATVISTSKQVILPLDSNASAICDIGDGLEIRHIGYKTLKIDIKKDNQIVELDEISYISYSIEISEPKVPPPFLGIKPNKRRPNPVYWGGIHEVALPIQNTTEFTVRLDWAHITIINEGMIEGVSSAYPLYAFRLYRDSLTWAQPQGTAITVQHTGEGMSTQSVSLDSFNLLLKPGQKVFIGLKAYTLTGGFYHTKLKRDVSLERRGNLDHTRRWGSWVSYCVLKDEEVYYMRNELGRNKNAWIEHRDKTVPAFYVTYQVVTE